MAGNPNPKGSKPDKLIRDALMLAIKREAEDANGRPTPKLTLMADALVDKAKDGDVQAFNAIADRIEGKPTQTIAGDPDAPLFSIDGLRDLLGAKLDRIADEAPAPEPQNVLN